MAVRKAKEIGLHEQIAIMIGAEHEGRRLTADEERRIRDAVGRLRRQTLEEEAENFLAHAKNIQPSETPGPS